MKGDTIMRRERLLNLGAKLESRRPPGVTFTLDEQLREQFPDRYQRYDKWRRQFDAYQKLLDDFLAKEKVDIP